MPQNIATAGPDRFAHANFLCPLGHAHEHDVHDSNASGHERNETNHERADAHHPSHRSESAFERVVGVDFKIVFLVSIKAARNSHRADPFIQCPVVKLGRERLGGDVHRAIGLAVILKKSCDRHYANVVLALPKRGAFFREHANDSVGMSSHPDDFADR